MDSPASGFGEDSDKEELLSEIEKYGGKIELNKRRKN